MCVFRILFDWYNGTKVMAHNITVLSNFLSVIVKF